jgi:hypothetical protein
MQPSLTDAERKTLEALWAAHDHTLSYTALTRATGASTPGSRKVRARLAARGYIDLLGDSYRLTGYGAQALTGDPV